MHPPRQNQDSVYTELCRLATEKIPHISTIYCFTEILFNDHIIRAHPSYRSGIPWNDWVYVNWEDFDIVLPGKVLTFVSLSMTSTINDLSKVYALIQSTKQLLPRNVNLPKLKLSDFYTYEDHLQLIPIDSIDGPCYAIENFKSINLDETPCDTIIAVAARDRWSHVYNNAETQYNN